MIKVKSLRPKFYANPIPLSMLVHDDEEKKLVIGKDGLELIKDFPKSVRKYFIQNPKVESVYENIDDSINRFIDTEIISSNELIDIKYNAFALPDESVIETALIIYEVSNDD